MTDPFQVALSVEEPGDAIPEAQQVGLEEDREEEQSVESAEDAESRRGRRRTGHRKTGLRVPGEAEPAPRMESLEEDVEQVDDDSPSRHDEIEAVTSGHVETRSTVPLDESEDPVEREIEPTTGDGQQQMEDEDAQPIRPETSLRSTQRQGASVDDETSLVPLQRQQLGDPTDLYPLQIDPSKEVTDVDIVVVVFGQVIAQVNKGSVAKNDNGRRK